VSQELTTYARSPATARLSGKRKMQFAAGRHRGNDQVRIGLESRAPMSGGWPS
jgi:hypothetical protein